MVRCRNTLWVIGALGQPACRHGINFFPAAVVVHELLGFTSRTTMVATSLQPASTCGAEGSLNETLPNRVTDDHHVLASLTCKRLIESIAFDVSCASGFGKSTIRCTMAGQGVSLITGTTSRPLLMTSGDFCTKKPTSA